MRLIEPSVIDHGPLWLGLIGDSLAALCRRLTVVHPDEQRYRGLASAADDWSARYGVDARLEPRATGARGGTHLPYEETLGIATAPGADLAFVSFLDGLMIRSEPRLLRRREGPTPVWGIWFGPPEPASRPARLRALVSRSARQRRRELNALTARPPWLAGAFFLDRSLAERVALARTRLLPDPWPTRPVVAQDEARRALGLPEQGRLFLHLGAGTRRKGLNDVIAAWDRVPESATLLRVGATTPAFRAGLRTLEETGRAVVVDHYVPEERVDLYFRACDWVLLPYRHHTGSSGQLSAAAASRRPVIAADHGVIGRRVREDGLGLLHAHGSVNALAEAVSRACASPTAPFEAALDRFAASHGPAAFTRALREGL